MEVVTVNHVPDLHLDVSDLYHPLNPSLHKANAWNYYPEVILYQCLAALGISLTSSFDRPGTIGRLSDDVLLNIFCYYLHESPRFWPTLVHICRKWRYIVFGSQQALHLRLICTPGMPVSKTIDSWPALPIVLEYGGSLTLDPPAPEDEVNIVAALKRSDRVSSISLTVTTSLLDKLYAIERPFLELENLILLSRDSVPLTVPNSFQCGPQLRRLHLTRISFPALLLLLHSSRNLVDLRLHEALNSWYFSMEELTDALSGMAQLQSLSLHFPPNTDYISPPSLPYRRVVLPALIRLSFRVPAKYLERLVLRIDAPRLGYIQVTLFDKSVIDLSGLGEFIDRIGIHKSHHQAHILSSERAISITLTRPGAPTYLLLRLLSEQSEQPSVVYRILPHFSASILDVEDLRISLNTVRPLNQKDSLRSGRWLELIALFTSVKWLHLDGNGSKNIARAIQKADTGSRHLTVLPALLKLYLPQPRPRRATLSKAVLSFMTSRWRSGHFIAVEYERLYHLRRGPGTLYAHGLYHYLQSCLKQSPFRIRFELMKRCSAMSSF